MNRHALQSVFLCLVVALAGCSAMVGDGQSPASDDSTTTTSPLTETTTPAGDDGATPTADDSRTPPPREALVIRATGNGSYTVTATAVDERNTDVRVYDTDGGWVTYADVHARGDLPEGALADATGVEPVQGGSSMSFAFRDGEGGVVGWPADSARLVYSVADADGRLVGWDYVDCGSGTVRVVTIEVADDGGVSAGHACTD